MQLSALICDSEVDTDAPTSSETTTTTDTGCLSSFPLLERIITQVLPAVLVILWQNAIMPLVLYSLALFEKTHISLSSIDRRILMLFFYWNMFNVFFGAILAGSISQEVKHLINNPGGVGTTLGTSLPRSSNFFINYLALRAFGLVPFRLILVHGGIWRWLFKCAPWPPGPFLLARKKKNRNMLLRAEAVACSPRICNPCKAFSCYCLATPIALRYRVQSCRPQTRCQVSPHV